MMDLKTDDALNVDIDPTILLSYGLDKLNLDSIPNDIFDQVKLTDEDIKNEDKNDVKNNISLKNDKVNESNFSSCFEIKAEKTSVSEGTCDTEINFETISPDTDIKKDINGNDESVSEKNLNELFDKLELSDSDNEEINDIKEYKERGPVRPCKDRRASRKKEWCKNDSYDKTQFNSERLKFWSGSSQIQYNENTVPNHYSVFNSHTTIYGEVEPSPNVFSQESCFEDTRASSVSSPESGYDSSSPHSITGSPPPVFTTSLNLDFIPETVDDQNIIDFLIENTDSALSDNLAVCNIDDKDAKGKINEIKNFLLKDMPSPLSDSSTAANTSQNLLNSVPFPNLSPILNSSYVKSSAVSCNSFSKTLEPKKLVPKLKEEAKGSLKQILSKEAYDAAKIRIYGKIREDKNNKKKGDDNISVIYVEDEMDNRTNLHNAVLKGKIEDIFSIVEINKQYNLPFADINIRDKLGKTALDYAIQNQMTLVIDYLKENTACQSVTLEK